MMYTCEFFGVFAEICEKGLHLAGRGGHPPGRSGVFINSAHQIATQNTFSDAQQPCEGGLARKIPAENTFSSVNLNRKVQDSIARGKSR